MAEEMNVNTRLNIKTQASKRKDSSER